MAHMSLILYILFTGVTNFEHSFDQTIKETILENETVELLFPITMLNLLGSEFVHLANETRALLEYRVDNLEDVDTGILLHESLRDNISHFFEDEQAVSNF